MEGEIEEVQTTTVETNLLTELASNETSLLALVQTLLSPSTLPHLALITLLSTVLYTIANVADDGDFASLAFISLSCGYVITALFSNNQRVKSLITLEGRSEENVKRNIVARMFSSFKICTLPLAAAGVTGVLIMMLFGQGSGFDLPAVFPISLGSLFILWAIAQGRSFGAWASSMAAKNLPEKTSASGNIKVMIGTQLLIVIILSAIGIIGFQSLYDTQFDALGALLSNIGFFFAALAVYALTVAWTWNYRKMALRDKALKQFASRWTLFAHVFATWHLLTVWRQFAMNPGAVEVFIEEVLLMMFTVFMAIWSITSQSVGEKFKLLSTDNALPWGLAFGYAYAGSVAMLATAFNDITTVMITGHIIALLTITWMQRSVLGKILDQHDLAVSSKRVQIQSTNEESSNQQESELKTKSESKDEEIDDSDAINVEWDGAVGPTISDGVEWGDVIEVDD